jgi:hypothetical protein
MIPIKIRIKDRLFIVSIMLYDFMVLYTGIIVLMQIVYS